MDVMTTYTLLLLLAVMSAKYAIGQKIDYDATFRKGPAYYEPISVDILRSTSRIEHVARFIDLKDDDDYYDGVSQSSSSSNSSSGSGGYCSSTSTRTRDRQQQNYHTGADEGSSAAAVDDTREGRGRRSGRKRRPLNEGWWMGIPQYIVINFQLPLYEPSLWGGNSDGYGISIILYFKLTEVGWIYDDDDDDDDENDDSGGGRLYGKAKTLQSYFKANQDDLKLSFVMKEIVRKFSGKPFLTRSRKEAYRGSNYLEIDINQHTSNYVKKKAVFGLKESLVDMVLDVGFLIESQEDDEMPENLIGTIRLQGIDFQNDARDVEWNRIVAPI
eukprot:jgi/Bigna1/137388/aug1.39_g12096